MVGGSAGDLAGSSGLTALPNGAYVVNSYFWHNGGNAEAGAVTWGNGTTGIVGTVNGSNSLVGSAPNDRIGNDGITVLGNSAYLVSSPYWDNGSVANVGAVTWASATGGISGLVNAGNSLIGSQALDFVGSSQNGTSDKITVLSNNNYVVSSPDWDNGSVTDAGAVTWGNGSSGTTGIVGANNSLVGGSTKDGVGRSDNGSAGGVADLGNGNYAVLTPLWNNGSVLKAGAVTLGESTGGTTGLITSCNSVMGNVANGNYYLKYYYNSTKAKLIVGKSDENLVGIITPAPTTVALANSSTVNSTAGYAVVPFVDNNCKLIASLRPAGSSPVRGSIEARVYVEGATPTTADGNPYSPRHYAVLPADSASFKTARVTLYFTQPDFDNYNSTNAGGSTLPTGSADAAGKAALRITQQRGTSATGTFNSFTGWAGGGSANAVIAPLSKDIIWNAKGAYWEVTFDVTGFGGFFLSAGNENPLALPAEAPNVSGISVSPIPAGNTLTITSSNGALAGSTFTALNLQGQVMATASLATSMQLDVQNWPAGIYLLKFADGSVVKVVKQ